MNDNQKLFLGLLQGLDELSHDELQTLRPMWMNELKRLGLSGQTMKLCFDAVCLVIDAKYNGVSVKSVIRELAAD